MRPPATRRRVRAAAALGGATLLAAALGGCGAHPTPVSGRAVFGHDCAICHSISGHPVPEQQGGDLLGLRESRVELVQSTVEMPVIHRPLTRREVQAVVDFILAAQRRR